VQVVKCAGKGLGEDVRCIGGSGDPGKGKGVAHYVFTNKVIFDINVL
jgi:hypothetical protein